MAAIRICKIPGCDKAPKARGWCSMHYDRWRVHGDPLGGRETFNGEPERFFREVVLSYKGDECLIWPYGRDRHGYGKLRRNGRDRVVSRLICEEVNGPPPTPQHEAAHECGCGNLGCVTQAHIIWKTRTENQSDKLTHGTHNRGKQHGLSKLTEHDVRQIRALRGKMHQRDLAEMFGVSPTTISQIQRRLRWKWLT
ncbi:helix-turn-helix transcriptional regulator [Chelativorans sp. AA-79]|uniref:helix-turn-helix domain-containing protein n=1 Tax=Chelativorans sp. AA-79 TaxID=3028735 RepID=UPI0023F66336|nr:helix-turn-helix transcriptional regulator [Chelativorans sp. AA-79]WEX10290.1 helix-turn-helix transcriptional regulator [Chelativorans sp. AA-79]